MRARRSWQGAPRLPALLRVHHLHQSREGGEGAGPEGAAATSSSCANPIGGDIAGGVVPSKKVAIGATATTAVAASADIVVRVGFGGGGSGSNQSTADPSRASLGPACSDEINGTIAIATGGSGGCRQGTTRMIRASRAHASLSPSRSFRGAHRASACN